MKKNNISSNKNAFGNLSVPNVDKKVLDKLKHLAIHNNISFSELIRRILGAYSESMNYKEGV